MFLLFLDTETTGVDYSNDQVIEVGGVIFDLDPITFKFLPIDRFQSTVALRQKLDDKISRITGITTEELSTAETITKVQTKWLNWLEQFEIKSESKIQAVIGHSVDFDLHFLGKEGWYLPTQKKIDTLALSKIIYPNLSAVNQEFLAKKLGLENKILFEDLNNLTHHRSLYDSLMCANLFMSIINEFNKINCSPKFAQYFETNFLNLGLHFYKKEVSQNINSEQTLKITKKLTLAGEDANIGQGDKIATLNNSTLAKLDELLDIKLTPSLTLVLAQIYSLNLANLNNSKFLKFHAQGGNFWTLNFFNIVLDYLNAQSGGTNSLKSSMPKYEAIIDQMYTVSDHNINLGQLIEFLEIMNQIMIAGGINDKSTASLLSQYDFLLFTLQPLLINCELRLNISNPTNPQKNFVTKLESFIGSLQAFDLKQFESDTALHSLLNFIRSQVIETIKSIYYDQSSYYTFRLSGKYLSMSRPKRNFVLQDHFDSILNLNPNLEILTNLTSNGFDSLNKLTKIELNQTKFQFKSKDADYDFEKKNNFEGLEYFQSKLEKSLSSGKICFVMCGLNSSINTIQKIILQDSALTKNTLIVGESGSLTKIASKIEQGFVGLVVVKFGSLNYFVSDYGQIKINVGEFVIMDKPYFAIHNFWYNKAKESSDEQAYLNELKELFLQAKVNYIHERTGADVEFVWNIK